MKRSRHYYGNQPPNRTAQESEVYDGFKDIFNTKRIARVLTLLSSWMSHSGLKVWKGWLPWVQLEN